MDRSSAGLKFFCSGSCTSAAVFAKYILKELRSDIGEKRSHDLTSWAEQECSSQCLFDSACWSGQWPCWSNLGAFHRCCDQGGQWFGGASCLYPLGSLCPKKAADYQRSTFGPLNQLTQVLIGLPRILCSQPFSKPINFERGGTSRLIGWIGEKSQQLATICYIDNGKEFSCCIAIKKAQWCPWRVNGSGLVEN